ncbi:MAG: hypothetical protein H0U23_00100, partial [Blastocatellia bacterium]|nr:hypothetical protein [Blastocatellia bacterium]
FQLTSQSLKRGTEVVQKFEYGYGQTNAAGEITPNSNNGQLAKIEAFIGAAKQWTQKFCYDSIERLSKSEEYRGDTNALTYKQVFDSTGSAILPQDREQSDNGSGESDPIRAGRRDDDIGNGRHRVDPIIS